MANDINPFCSRCGFRTFPQWGSHQCKKNVMVSPDEIIRIRHVAGDIISNLHFYRIPPDLMIAAVAEALAFLMADTIHPARLNRQWENLIPQIRDLMQTQILRQAKGAQSENIVMDVNRPRMKAKIATQQGARDDRRDDTKKTDRPHHQAIPTGGARRHGRPKRHHRS